MSKKTRLKAPAAQYPVPQTKDQANGYVAAIGVAQRELARIEAAMNDELAAIKERFEQQAEPLKSEISERTKGVQMWCESNREALTQGGKVKSAQLPAGEIGWRMRPPSVGLRGVDAVIETLKRLGLGRFIRTKEEVNKEAILNEQAAVAGVAGITINQGEDFFVQPYEAELASAA